MRLPGKLPVSHHVILVSRPDREKGGEDRGVDQINRSEMEHDPTHRDHLGHGADFADSEGLDGDLTIEIVEDPDADNDFKVAGHDEDDEPNGQMPIDSPVHKGRGKKPGHQEGLVGERIEDGPGERFLVKVPGDPAIESIKNRCEGVDRDRQPADRFLGGSGIH